MGTTMRRIDLYFLLLATISLLVGVSIGIWMGIAHEFQFAPAHAHLNLVGWVSLALFGLAYRTYPELGDSRIAGVHFVFACVGAIVFPVGIALAIAGVTVAVATGGALIWMVAVVLFLVNLARITFARAESPAFMPAE
jgi:cbb3-type cytochrome oxidase subunit 1